MATTLERWYEQVWNNANENSIDDLLDEQAVIHGLGTETDKKGPTAFRPFYHSFRESFPSVNIQVEPIFQNPEFEAAQCTVNAATADGRRVNFTGLSIIRVKDGKLIEGWNAFDFETMNKQLREAITTDMEQPK